MCSSGASDNKLIGTYFGLFYLGSKIVLSSLPNSPLSVDVKEEEEEEIQRIQMYVICDHNNNQQQPTIRLFSNNNK